MKKLHLLAAVALSCCAVSPTFAQVQILRNGVPTPAPRLVSDRTSLAELEPLPIASPDSAAAIPNPFDYFDQELPQIDPQATTIEEALPNLVVDEPAAAGPNSDAERDPKSLPVGRHHRQNSPSMVDTIVSQAALGNIPNASVTPIYWGGAPQTPNPVAEWLLREDCVGGLWANYPQQRAAECADMWNCLSGNGCGCGAGGCGHGGCATGACGTCNTCSAPAAPRNRYLERLSALPMGCNTCAQTAAPCATCNSCQQNYGAPTPGCSECAQNGAQATQPTQPTQHGPAQVPTSVAKLPPPRMFR